jgi:hypothetical protein
MTFTHNPITDSKIIGRAPDGSALRTWNEGPRSFVETYDYFKTTSGTTYGLVVVVETTAVA